MKNILQPLISPVTKNSLAAFSVVILFSLVGCANPVWNKPGASTNEFNQDKYACMQESRQQTSSTVIGANGQGFGVERESTNTDLFDACMYARGWNLQNVVAAAPGNICLPSVTKVGNIIKQPDGSSAIVRSIFGTSSRCSQPDYPILATVDATQQTAQDVQADGSYLAGRAAFVSHNYQEALVKLGKSADLGNAEAQGTLGYMYENGLGVTKDYAEAVRWYRKAADQGNAAAQTNLGIMYLGGAGIPKDYKTAFSWFEKAAQQGNAQAQSNLGWLYMLGNGVTADFTVALSWFKKAADQGNAMGENNLGVMYEHGFGGLTKDIDTAISWYKKAAAQGYQLAAANLKRLGVQ